MNKRNLVKWQPFSAVIPGKYLVDKVMKDKNKIEMPILSDDQLKEIENKLIRALELQDTISLLYYKDGKLYRKVGKVKKIDVNKRKIFLSETFSVYFEQIIRIFLKKACMLHNYMILWICSWGISSAG